MNPKFKDRLYFKYVHRNEKILNLELFLADEQKDYYYKYINNVDKFNNLQINYLKDK